MTRNVYQLIADVSAELCKEGISKDRTNSQGQGYKFRGIDDVYNAMSPIISKHGLVILPRILTREITERISGAGKALFFVAVEAEFDFVSSHDGSIHTVRTFGEAMDSGDKATNKAMSAAYKYAAFQSFCIPTEGDNDADSTTHSVSAKDAKTETKKSLTSSIEKTLPEYTSDKFDANKSAWVSAINSGKHTPNSIINMISTKHTLTNEQKEAIKKLGAIDANS